MRSPTSVRRVIIEEIDRIRSEGGRFTGHHRIYTGTVTDCFSLVIRLWSVLGHEFPDWPRYDIPLDFWKKKEFSVLGHRDFFHDYLIQFCDFVERDPREGEVMGFALNGRTIHLGMYVGNNEIAVCHLSEGPVIKDRDSNPLYVRGFRGLYIPKGW